MALTTNKKNKIIAEWKAGIFSSYNAVAVQYKIDPKTVKKILYGISQSNTDIVEVGTKYEMAKKSIKNTIEIKAIEKAIIERTIADEIEHEVFSGTLENVRSVRKKIQLEEVETMQEHRHAQATLDQALITVGKADRYAPKQDISLTNAQQTNIPTQINIIKDV